MLFETEGIRVTSSDGVATLWLAEPITEIAQLESFVEAIDAVVSRPGLELLVVRSAYLNVFRGYPQSHSNDSRRYARQLLGRLRELPLATLAYLRGPCLGSGLDIALACDYRLAVASPDCWIGYPQGPTGWGGFTQVVNQHGRRAAKQTLNATLTPREARDLGIIHKACCERRANIELNAAIQRIQSRPVKPLRWFGSLKSWFIDPEAAYRDELRLVNHHARDVDENTASFLLPKSLRIHVDHESSAAIGLIAEFAMRGVEIFTNCTIGENTFTQRQRLTPLEAQQAARRIRPELECTPDTTCEFRLLTNHADLPVSHPRQLHHRLVIEIRISDNGECCLLTHSSHMPKPMELHKIHGWFRSAGCQLTTVQQSTIRLEEHVQTEFSELSRNHLSTSV